MRCAGWGDGRRGRGRRRVGSRRESERRRLELESNQGRLGLDGFFEMGCCRGASWAFSENMFQVLLALGVWAVSSLSFASTSVFCLGCRSAVCAPFSERSDRKRSKQLFGLAPGHSLTGESCDFLCRAYLAQIIAK